MVLAVVEDEAAQRRGRAQRWVTRGRLRRFFAFDAILLVSESQGGKLDLLQVFLVIQRQVVVEGVVDAVSDGEVNVTQAECL